MVRTVIAEFDEHGRAVVQIDKSNRPGSVVLAVRDDNSCRSAASD